MPRLHALSVAALAVLLTNCDDPPETEPPEAELPVPPVAAELELDTIGWYAEGRPVTFAEREWVPWGDPVVDPIVTPVGEFEGTQLYALADDTAPYDRLFVPAGGDRWLGLYPRDMLPDTTEGGPADTGAATP